MSDLSTRWVNLASDKLGAKCIDCTDDFFAPMHRMLNTQPPVFIDGKYDDNGKWMDGWESRRKRGGGYDWCIVKLARAGVIHAIEIDTTHFTGNYPPQASLEACFFDGDAPDDSAKWVEVLPQTKLQGDHEHQFDAPRDAQANTVTHVRLNLFPDGGVARLRIYGSPQVDWNVFINNAAEQMPDLAAALNGGVALCCNDEHFGAIRNLLLPERGANMGDGWETRRRREPGNDWAIIALAHPGVIKKVEIDTAHFKGNYPDRCSVQGACVSDPKNLPTQSEKWQEILPQVKLSADSVHTFSDEIIATDAVTHLRLNIFPDGGVSRFRAFGEVKVK